MSRQDWPTTITILVMTLLVLNFFVLNQQQNQVFKVGSTWIKYHSNWTQADEQLHHVSQLQNAYKLTGIRCFDLSLSMSSLNFSRVKTLLPVSFPVYDNIKINLANNPIGTFGADYVLSLIPNGVQNLQIAFDSIQADDRLGVVLAKRLNNLNSLKKLKISLIMAVKNDTVLDDYLRFGRLGENLESYSVVLIGNALTNNSLGFLKTHLSRANLKELDLNFYANKLGAEGANIVADAILTQKSLKDLSLDLYFNNITQVGTESLSKSILEINNPELRSLNYNLDFNYIKNEGAKAVGKTLSEMQNLRVLNLGVASKNFGYLGFKHIINGMGHLTNLQELSLKCGVNRVGSGGAQITRDLIQKLKNLKKLSLNFYQNYVGDQGLIELAKAATSIDSISELYLNFGFNDAKGYGLIKCMEVLAKKTFKELYLSFSSNQFQDSEINLIKDELREIIRKTPHFEMELMETAISKKKAQELKDIFQSTGKSSGYKSKINVNSIISEEEESKYQDKAKDREQKLQELMKKDKESIKKSTSGKEAKNSDSTDEKLEL